MTPQRRVEALDQLRWTATKRMRMRRRLAGELKKPTTPSPLAAAAPTPLHATARRAPRSS